MTKYPRILPLKCQVQHYEWGKIGTTSAVAQLSSTFNEQPIHEDIPYAEMWMGTHAKAPSFVMLEEEEVPLSHIHEEFLAEKANLAAKPLTEKPDIPFLLKVLSIRKALSLQVHPNKEQAKKLFQASPEIYKDDNHKPEMTIALTNFEALCGFRPISEIVQNLRFYQELRYLVEKEAVVLLRCQSESEERQQWALKLLWSKLMNVPNQSLRRCLGLLLTKIDTNVKQGSLEELFLRLHDQFPGDIGCLSVFFLNYIRLEPGEALFLAANEPHAYLAGDCVECMAQSDNVIRAGLTPKYRDVDALLDTLSYRSYHPDDCLFTGIPITEFSLLYAPPVDEFRVTLTNLWENQREEIHTSGPSILLITEGEGMIFSETISYSLSPGSVFYVAPETVFVLECYETLSAYRAYCD